MADQRIRSLANILVQYSTRVQSGDLVTIEGPPAAEPLLTALFEAVLAAGGNPAVQMSLTAQSELLHELGSDDQLSWISPAQRMLVDQADARIAVIAPVNTRDMSSIPPERQAIRQRAMRPVLETVMRRGGADELKWVGTIFPTQALAAEANMSLRRYEDMYYAACLADRPDPVAAWQEQAAETNRLVSWMNGREHVHITAPGTDIKLSIAGRTFVPGDGRNNMPDGEFFTGPVEDSAEGIVQFTLPAVHGGRHVSGVQLRFKDGKVVDASADQNEDFLVSLLDSDPGARFLGELGIGTNFGLDRGTSSILLDEKIGGTVHLAVGASYPETGGTNQSSLHWDMICDLRNGGRITVDGELFQENGTFVV
jgi:aminopeptidase